MAKKKRAEKHVHRQQSDPVKEVPKGSFSVKPTLPQLILGLIVLVTLVIYLPVFSAGFVWDDTYYIENNQLIRSIDPGSIFSKYVMGNYHPFTVLALAIQYQLFDLHAPGYHAINVLMHLINIYLVYYALFLLTQKNIVALVTALLFGIHPLHTESVAWISGLKDLLYTSFFLGAVIFYLKYLDDKQRKFYLLAILLFLFSLLSKAMAACLPLLLLLIDYYKNRKMEMKTWIEKIPFFLLAIIFGIIAIFAQRSSASIQDMSVYPFSQRLIFASLGFITYLWKSFLPIQQSAFYPYPVKSGESLSILFYAYPLLLLAVTALVIYSGRFTKKMIFGLLFFTLCILLVLQILPVGNAVMADRYTYISLIGIFYLAGEVTQWLWNRYGKGLTIGLLAVMTIFFSAFTYSRNQVWSNGITLWTDVIKKYPDALLAYNNRGGTYMNQKKYELALADLNKVIRLDPGYAEALSNRGIIFYGKKMYKEALDDLDRAVESRPDYVDALSNRGTILMELNKNAEALNDFNTAIKLNPEYAEAYYNRGLLYMNEKKYELALKDYDKALVLKPGYTEAIINRGIILNDSTGSDKLLTDYNKAIDADPTNAGLYYDRGSLMKNLNKNAEAISDFNMAIKLKPDHARAYLDRATIFITQKDTLAALNDYNSAIGFDPTLAEAYLGRGNILRNENKNDKALADYNKAIELNPLLAGAYYNRGILFIKEKRFEEVVTDFSKVLELKGDSAMSYYNRGMAEIFLNRKDIACGDLQLAAGFGLRMAMDANKQFCQ